MGTGKATRKAGKSATAAFDADRLRRSIDRHVAAAAALDGVHTHAWSWKMGAVAKKVEHFVATRNAAQVVELAEYAIQAIDQQASIPVVSFGGDDGEGPSDALSRFERIHYAACRKAKPEPLALARRLLDLWQGSMHGVFHDFAAQYAPIFGQAHLREIGHLIETASVGAPAQSREGRDQAAFGWLLENLARKSGNTKWQLEVLERLGKWSAVADLLHKSGQPELALQALERGHVDAPGSTSGQLARTYFASARASDALRVLFEVCASRPTPSNIKDLRDAAREHGGWEPWRERVIDAARRFGRDHGETPSAASNVQLTQRTAIVALLLEEGRPLEAYAEAAEGGCHYYVWMALQRALWPAHSQLALVAGQRAAEEKLKLGYLGMPEDAIALVAAMFERLGRWSDYLAWRDALPKQLSARANLAERVERALPEARRSIR
jgi:hypothetical protein